MWQLLTFLLNSLLFILVGLQLPAAILEQISEDSVATLALYAAVVYLTVTRARFVRVFPAI